MDELDLPVVLVLEGGDHSIAQTVAASAGKTDLPIATLNSLQSVTANDVQAGITYLDVMRANLDVLRQGARIIFFSGGPGASARPAPARRGSCMTQICRRLCALMLLVFFSRPLPCTPARAEAVGAQDVIVEVCTEKGPLKLRRAPDSDARILAEMPRGSLATAQKHDDRWYRLVYDGLEGYAMAEFLTPHGDLSPDVLNYHTLQNGDCGEEVTALKQRLSELGYYREGSKMTNRFNDTLIQRVKMFQRQHGLEEDGVATPALQALLFSDGAQANTEPLPEAPTHYRRTQSSSGGEEETQWRRAVCECCNGKGCICCGYTGWVWSPD